MTKKSTGPVAIIAVRDVVKTSKLLIKLFHWKSEHDGDEFNILMNKKGMPMLMLHDFEAHAHARFREINKKSKGVGQSLYVFVSDIPKVYKKVQQQKLKIIERLFLNENSGAREFTFRIKEGYQFTVCDTDRWLYFYQ